MPFRNSYASGEDRRTQVVNFKNNIYDCLPKVERSELSGQIEWEGMGLSRPRWEFSVGVVDGVLADGDGKGTA